MSRGGRLTIAGLVGMSLVAPRVASAQVEWGRVEGYVLAVAGGQTGNVIAPASANTLARLRLMARPRWGAVAVAVAYEHLGVGVTRSGAVGSGGILLSPAGVAWLDLDGTIVDGRYGAWRHRLDRAQVTWEGGDWEVTAGRQPISWATTLFLTPADPFAPLTPSDPFREYRGGVDAVRIQRFLGPFQGLDVVLRMVDDVGVETITAAGRWHGAWGAWDLAGWVGVVHDRGAASASVTTTAVGAAWRGEVVWRDEITGAVWRAAVGADRRFGIWGRDLVVLAEVQYDGFGAANAEGLPAVVRSPAARRGELQVAGRRTAALQASLQITALAGVDLLTLANLDDGSALMGIGATYSAGQDVSVRAGTYVGLGSEGTAPRPGSEFGPAPAIGYLAVTAFF